jgi:two-component sensor histidine kinase
VLRSIARLPCRRAVLALSPEDSFAGADVCRELGNLYIKTNQIAKAAFCLSKAERRNVQFGSPTDKREVALYLYRIDSIRENYPSALVHFRQYTALNNALINEAKNKQIALLQIQFDTEKKEQNIRLLTENARRQQSELRQTRLARNSIITGALLLLGLLYSRYRVKKRGNQLLETKQLQINQQNQSLTELLGEKEDLLVEKEWMLKEIHHRVKNNLQVISSLLATQSRYLQDEATVAALRESQNRVQTMALTHQMLYQGPNLAAVPMRPYITEIAHQLLDSFDRYNSVQTRLAIDDVELNVVLATPLGMIVNEAVTNVLKYAFPQNQPGTLSIALVQLEEQAYELRIDDDGVGLPLEFDVTCSQTLGLTMIKGLSQQIRGQLSFSHVGGVHLHLRFKAA